MNVKREIYIGHLWQNRLYALCRLRILKKHLKVRKSRFLHGFIILVQERQDPVNVEKEYLVLLLDDPRDEAKTREYGKRRTREALRRESPAGCRLDLLVVVMETLEQERDEVLQLRFYQFKLFLKSAYDAEHKNRRLSISSG